MKLPSLVIHYAMPKKREKPVMSSTSFTSGLTPRNTKEPPPALTFLNAPKTTRRPELLI